MHGLLINALRRYADEQVREPWSQLLERAGLRDRVYLPVATYPDEEASRLFRSVARASGRSLSRLQEELGEWMTPDLVTWFGGLLDPGWEHRDLLESIDRTIERIGHEPDLGLRPPALQCSRVSGNELVIEYRSPRRMCAMLRGVVRGMARHLHEDVDVSEPVCALTGAPACLVKVRLVPHAKIRTMSGRFVALPD